MHAGFVCSLTSRAAQHLDPFFAPRRLVGEIGLPNPLREVFAFEFLQAHEVFFGRVV
jgi:hypothetical protein